MRGSFSICFSKEDFLKNITWRRYKKSQKKSAISESLITCFKILKKTTLITHFFPIFFCSKQHQVDINYLDQYALKKGIEQVITSPWEIYELNIKGKFPPSPT